MEARPARTRLTPGFRIGASFAARFDDRGEHLVTLGKRISVWNVASRRRACSVGGVAHASHVDFSPDSTLLAAKSTSGEVAVFDLQTIAERTRFSGRAYGEGATIRFSPCGRYLVDASWRGQLLVRDVATGAHHLEEAADDGDVFDLACTRDRQVWSYTRWSQEGGTRVFVRAWPFDRHQPVEIQGLTRCHAHALSDDARRLAVSDGQTLTTWSLDPTTGATQELGERHIVSGTPDVLTWSPDAAYLAHSGDSSGHIYAATTTLPELHTLPLPYACDVEFSPSSNLLALGAWSDGIVIAWPPLT